MQPEFISPNLHVVLIHYPLALLVIGTLIELFAFLWRKSSFRTAGRWMILIGALSAVPATFSGVYAMRQVARVPADDPDANSWRDIKAKSDVLSNRFIWDMMHRHMLYQSIATAAACAVVLIWLASSDRLRRSLHLPLVLLMAATVALMIYGARYGGDQIYQRGVAVTAIAVNPTIAPPSTQPTDWATTPTRIELNFPPVEMHTILAGWALAFALVSIGLSVRKITASGKLVETAFVTGPASGARDVDMLRTFNPDLEFEARPFVPASRFWMLTFLLALLTALGGAFVTARDFDDLLPAIRQDPKHAPQAFWDRMKPDAAKATTATDSRIPPPTLWTHIKLAIDAKINRRTGHMVSGILIVVLPILLALMARVMPRSKFALSVVTLLLVCAVSAQVWLGILMLLDTPVGSVSSFN